MDRPLRVGAAGRSCWRPSRPSPRTAGRSSPWEGGAAEPAAAAPSTTDWSAPTTVYIPETGHTIDGVFLDYWRANYGLNNYGLPISPSTSSDGRIVQYYQYARFEYWPEDADGEIVKLGAIGEELRPKALPRSTVAAPARGRSGAWPLRPRR
jgi:hypothetical protein